MATELYTSRVVLNTLGIEDYGIYNVVGGVIAMFGFLNTVMSTSTHRYLTFQLGKKNIEKIKKVFFCLPYLCGIMQVGMHINEGLFCEVL